MKIDIRGLSEDQIIEFFEKKGFDSYRGRQVYEWIWRKSCYSFDEMTNISKDLRDVLDNHFVINHIQVDKIQKSFHGTIKNAVKLHDDHTVESVLIPTDDRTTACVSSQVGCSLDCKFCATSKLKRMRNLNPDEISGIPKMIKKLADENLKVNLALSLHSAIEETRNKIMPFSKKFSLDEIKDSLIYWYSKTKRKITFEYIVWKDINDSIEHIIALVNYCKSIPSKVNLIEYNSIGDQNFESANQNMINLYKDILEKNRITVTVRRSRGKDIDAACGQLANK